MTNRIENRSKYINELIESDRQSKLEASMGAGYIAQAQDPAMQEEEMLWSIAIADGIEDED